MMLVNANTVIYNELPKYPKIPMNYWMFEFNVLIVK